jgi:hypothetical protein
VDARVISRRRQVRLVELLRGVFREQTNRLRATVSKQADLPEVRRAHMGSDLHQLSGLRGSRTPNLLIRSAAREYRVVCPVLGCVVAYDATSGDEQASSVDVRRRHPCPERW